MSCQDLGKRLVSKALSSIWRRGSGSRIDTRFLHGAFWSLLGSVVARLLGLLVGISIARILGRTGYGELGMVQSTMGLMGLFAGMGMGATATKHLAEFRDSNPRRAGRILGFTMVTACIGGAIMAVATVFLSPWLADRALSAPRLATALKASSLVLFFSTVNGVQLAALTGLESFKKVTFINIGTGLMALPAVAGGTLWLGLTGAMLGYAAAAALSCLFGGSALGRECTASGIQVEYGMRSSEWRMFWRFSFPATMAGIMVIPVNWICMAMLARRQGGYAEMGVFNAANQWYVAATMLPAVLGQVSLPILAERIGTGDVTRAWKLVLRSIRIGGLVILIPAIVCSALSSVIMGFYGPAFSSGWTVLVVCLLTACIVAVQTPVGVVLMASGRLWTGFLMNAGWAVAFIGAAMLFSPWGALGLGAARLSAYLLHTVWVGAYAWHILRERT